MSEPPVDADSSEPASSDIRRAASQAVSQGVDIRALVHDVTLSALQMRRFDAQGFRGVVRAVTEGVVLGAEQGRRDMRSALSDAFGGLDDAVLKSAQAGQVALRQLAQSGQDFSDNEFKQALASLRKIEDEFLAVVSLVADGASQRVGPELSRILGSARTDGTQTGKQVALTMGEFAQRFGAASLDVTIAGVQAAGVYGTRFAMLASGILSGLADALRPSAPDAQNPPELKPEPKQTN